MRAPGIARGVLLSLMAGLAAVPFQLLLRPILGGPAAFALYVLALSVAAPLWYAPSLRAGLAPAALGTLLVLPAVLVGPSPPMALFFGLLVLGVGRSGVCYRWPLPRALAAELSLGAVAMCAALAVYDRGFFGSALSVWCFWLVQSAYCLLGTKAPAVPEASIDPFNVARDAAKRLMRP